MKLIIFDFDGTLADSRRLIWESHRIVFGEFGLAVPSREQSLALIGMSLERVLERLAGPGAPVNDMVLAYQRLLPQLRADPVFADAPFDGAEELLASFSGERDIRLGIATGHVLSAISPVLDKFGWRKFFSTIQTPDHSPSKPHPGMLLRALQETGIEAEDAVMIGDTEFDIEMAHAAGVRALGVSWGYHPADRLRRAGAVHIAESLDLLGQLLRGTELRPQNP